MCSLLLRTWVPFGVACVRSRRKKGRGRDKSRKEGKQYHSWTTNSAKLCMICDLLALRLISNFVQKTLSFLHSTKIEQITQTMVMFKTGAFFLCCIRYYPIPPQTSVQRLAHTHNVTTCCSPETITILLGTIILF